MKVFVLVILNKLSLRTISTESPRIEVLYEESQRRAERDLANVVILRPSQPSAQDSTRYKFPFRTIRVFFFFFLYFFGNQHFNSWQSPFRVKKWHCPILTIFCTNKNETEKIIFWDYEKNSSQRWLHQEMLSHF